MGQDTKIRTGRSLGEAAEYVVQVIQSFGVDAHGYSRLAQMRNLVSPRCLIPANHPRFDAACEALRDISMLEFSFDTLLGVIPRNQLIEKVKLLVKDSLLPQDDSQDTPGRNTQSELYVAAICHAAGLQPRFAEPDILVDFSGKCFGLAVKRFKNLKRLREHFEKAASQIERAKFPGIVVFDIGLAANPGNEKVSFLVRDDQFLDFQKKRLHPFFQSKKHDFREWRRGREVRGILFLDQLVCLKDEQGHYCLRGFNSFGTIDLYNANRRKEGQSFFEQFKKGVPNCHC